MGDVGTILLSSATGAVVGFVSAVVKTLVEGRARIDDQLRAERLRLYKELWEATALLPEWPRDESVTYTDLKGLARRFRDWYFRGGGIYLSGASRVAYGAVQDAIAAEFRDEAGDEPDRPLRTESYDAVRERCSSLRTSLTDDLLSRRGAPFQRRRKEPTAPH